MRKMICFDGINYKEILQSVGVIENVRVVGRKVFINEAMCFVYKYPAVAKAVGIKISSFKGVK